MTVDFLAAQAAENLRRWKESGQPRRWVAERQGHWDHAAWEQLLRSLRASDYWPLRPDAVGHLLEEVRRERANLQRWLASGQPRQWVAYHGGRWGHVEWVCLLDSLRYSEFWPLDPAELGRVLEQTAQEWRNLRRWQDSGDPRRWVAAHDGQWDHADWLNLLATLRQSAFWPLDPADVGQVLEEQKRAYLNVKRFRESGQARRLVALHAGHGDHAARLALYSTLQQSEFWPMDPVALEEALAGLQQEARNLRRWQESGAARRWVEEHKGQWTPAEWQSLLARLRTSEFWPLDPEAVGRLVADLKLEYWNLDRWRVSGLARHWVEAHQGEWTEQDYQALLADLQKYHFWPIDTDALQETLADVKADWWQLRPWLQPGQALRTTEPSRKGLRGLLESLHRAEFWPTNHAPARQAA